MAARWTHAGASNVVTGLVRATDTSLVALLPEEPNRTYCLTPVSREAVGALALTRHVVTGGTVVTLAHVTTLVPPRTLVAWLVAVLTSPARSTSAGTSHGVTGATVLTLALHHTPRTILVWTTLHLAFGSRVTRRTDAGTGVMLAGGIAQTHAQETALLAVRSLRAPVLTPGTCVARLAHTRS